MNTSPVPAHPPGLNLGDIYFTLFRHKWKILLCTLAGIATAAVIQRQNPPPYQSEAKLFVRYIISESKTLSPTAQEATAKSPDQRGETIMKSEAEILGSLDLAKQVAESFGPEKILAKAGGGKDLNKAVGMIKGGLSIGVQPGSSVIHVVFKHPDPEIVQPVLREVITNYFKLHVQTHTASGMLGDFLSAETDQLRARLNQTEEDLRKAMAKAEVISLEDAKRTYAEQMLANRRDLFEAQSELAQRISVLEELTKRGAALDAASESEGTIPPDVIEEYRVVAGQVETFRRMEQDLLTQFTPSSDRVKEVRAQLSEAEQKRADFHKRYPKLYQFAPANGNGRTLPSDPASISIQITALHAKIKALNAQRDELRASAAKVDEMEAQIIELRRKKEVAEANYRYYAASMEQARINEALGNGRVSNISEIQTPSPPYADAGRLNKKLGMILVCGLFGGIAWAFLIELYLDRSIKRPIDVERALDIPLFLAIPRISKKQLSTSTPRLLTASASPENGSPIPNTAQLGMQGADGGGALQLFHDTLRDRLIGYFESLNLTHKPKLVAVTGLGSNSGVTTTAAGLARSLSETGEGNVLLVDMNVGHGVAQQFLKGQAVCGIDDILQSRTNGHVDEKLYVVAENNSDRLSRNLPQRFTKLVPKLKASDFDYIIFDMPPVTQISITPRLAGFMDMVLLVIESEKTDRDVVQRAANLLAESRAHVGAVLNKTKTYVPPRLFQDSLGNS